MDIEGPIKISYLDKPEENIRELMFDFTDNFKALSLADQSLMFSSYLTDLSTMIKDAPEDGRDQMGMMLTQQICEQLLDPIKKGELALEDTIVVEIPLEQSVDHITDLLS